VQLNGEFTLHFGPTDQIKCLQRMSTTAVWQVWMSEVRRQIVRDTRPSCTEGSVAEVGLRPTDKKRTSVSWVQFSYVNFGDEAAVVIRVACPDNAWWTRVVTLKSSISSSIYCLDGSQTDNNDSCKVGLSNINAILWFYWCCTKT